MAAEIDGTGCEYRARVDPALLDEALMVIAMYEGAAEQFVAARLRALGGDPDHRRWQRIGSQVAWLRAATGQPPPDRDREGARPAESVSRAG